MLYPMWRACMGAFLCFILLATAEAATGDWDRSYGTEGRLQLLVPGVPFHVSTWEPLADGKIVTAGRGMTASGQETDEFVIARLNADGTADSSFDGDGVVTIAADGGDIDVAPLIDGRLLVAAQFGIYGHVALLRLNADGSRDTTFGSQGMMTFANPIAIYSFRLAVAADGAAVIVSAQPRASIVVTRVTAAGVLDTTFGFNGRVLISVPSSTLEARSIVVQPDGSIVLGGTLYRTDNRVAFIGRMTNSGRPDTSFGTNGVAELPVLDGYSQLTELISTAEGKLIAAGSATDAAGVEQRFVARLNADGALDQSFGSGGRIILPADEVSSLALDPDGKLVVAGMIDQFGVGVAWLARYNSDGSPDVTFGRRGHSLADFTTGPTLFPAQLQHVRRDPDGSYRALLGFALVRFAASGTHPGVIGIHGYTEDAGVLRVNERAGTYFISAYRTGGTEGTLTVQYRLVAGTATAGQDFVASTGELQFNEGEIEKTFTFQTLDDATPEGIETFYVELFQPTGGAGLSRSRVNVQIINDSDRGSTIGLLGTQVQALESAGSVRLLVQRSGDLSRELTINYATSGGSATASADFSETSGSVTWAANEGGVRTLDIPLVNDAAIESLEQFSVTLSSSDPVAVINSGTRTATIQIADDDDAAATPKLSFTTSTVPVAEGAGSVTLEVHRLGGASQALSATWSVSNSSVGATRGQDYSNVSGTLSWGVGDSAPRTLTIPILDDASLEYPEDFIVSLAAGPTASAVIERSTVTIIDNESGPLGLTVSMGSNASFAESVGTASVNVTMTGLLTASATVTYTVVHETAGTRDFTLESGSLTWVPGDAASKQLSIPIVADTLDEIDETFSIHLTSAHGGVWFGATTRARFTIVDDDATPPGQPGPLPPSVRLESSNVSVGENEQSVTLTVMRTGDGGSFNVPYVITGGTATSPDDYVAQSGVLSWYGDGDYPQSVLIHLNGDAQSELDETFTVKFMPSVPGLGTQPEVTATVTLVDDDQPSSPAQVEFVSAAQSVNESATTVTLQVARSGNTAVPSSVNYATVAGSATSADFVTATGTLTWQPNDTSTKLITLTLTPDAIDESDESFTVTLSDASAGTQIASGSATVTITDDDAPSSGSSSGGRGGGGEESLISLLLWAALVSVRQVARARRRMPPLS